MFDRRDYVELIAHACLCMELRINCLLEMENQ
jgi:hypothetical protein